VGIDNFGFGIVFNDEFYRFFDVYFLIRSKKRNEDGIAFTVCRSDYRLRTLDIFKIPIVLNGEYIL
jgi:hypothetical protein